jgi:Zn-dependent peptidase ImmA (M78 family)
MNIDYTNNLEIKLEIERIVNKFIEENNLDKISVIFKEPKEKETEWKKNRGHYDRKNRIIYIKLERDTKALIFQTVAHELAHVLSPSDINHKY